MASLSKTSFSVISRSYRVSSSSRIDRQHHHHSAFGRRTTKMKLDGGKMSTASVSGDNNLTADNMNPCVKRLEYAVRGPLVIRATEIVKELKNGTGKPKDFTNVIKANIGDAHAMGQEPLTFLRQVLSATMYPALLNSNDIPDDAKERANTILNGCANRSVGSYSDSAGIEVIRRHCAEYIRDRDGGVPSSWENVVLCAGASEGIRGVLNLFFDPEGPSRKPGVMIPIPQYPLYSATLAEYNMHQIGYYLDEDANWALDINELERAIKEAREISDPRAMVVINPGNPTGSVLSRDNIESIVKFAHKEKLFIFADEVYQHNVYAEGCAFHSFKKVMHEMGEPYRSMELASFMSTSKGFMGECGIRGGYTELCNVHPEVKRMFLKSVSAKLCPSVIGQACMDVVVNPPTPGEPSYESFQAQKRQVLASLAERAAMIADTFNAVEGIKCNVVQGAMYAFPKLQLPDKAIEAAKRENKAPDTYYAFKLLEKTGICIVPGSGFGQKPGTHHFRTTILPQKEALVTMLDRLRIFHEAFLKEHS